MDQEIRWITRYNEVKDFIEVNKRNPSKHRIEEHDMLNWLKANRKVMNAGSLKPERVEPFKQLLGLIEKYKRLNQYVQVRSLCGAEGSLGQCPNVPGAGDDVTTEENQ